MTTLAVVLYSDQTAAVVSCLFHAGHSCSIVLKSVDKDRCDLVAKVTQLVLKL